MPSMLEWLKTTLKFINFLYYNDIVAPYPWDSMSLFRQHYLMACSVESVWNNNFSHTLKYILRWNAWQASPSSKSMILDFCVQMLIDVEKLAKLLLVHLSRRGRTCSNQVTDSTIYIFYGEDFQMFSW